MTQLLPRLAAARAVQGDSSALTREQVEAALPEMEKYVTQVMEDTGVPGIAIVVVFQDEVIYLQGFGVRETGKDAPVDGDTVFQLASLSKPIASTVVAALVGEGIVDWDDKIVDLYPGFQLYDPWATRAVTIRDLFAHRSGLPDHAGDLLEDLGFDRTQVLHRLRYLPAASSMRSTYAYTNFGVTLAAEAAATAAGAPWEQLSEEKLYKPLAMNSTSSRYAGFLAEENRALGHVLVDGRWAAKYARDPDAQSPAGGVSSSARDMAQWVRLQLGNGSVDGKQIVDSKALAETHRPQVICVAPHDPAQDQASLYGLGWNVGYRDAGRVRLGHSGAFELGAGTAVTLLPEDRLGIVVLTNAAPIGVPEAVINTYLDLVRHGQPTRDWLAFIHPLFTAMSAPPYGNATNFYQTPPATPLPPLELDAYRGTYANDYFGDVTIRVQDGELVMLLGPDASPFPLQHWNRDVFLYQPTGESAAGLSGVTFTIGPDGAASSVELENLAATKVGTFTRTVL